MATWGPFAHIPDGEIGDGELAVAREAIHEFARRATAPMGRMTAMVGLNEDRQAAVAASIGDEVADVALAVWGENFVGNPDWERTTFAGDVGEMLAYRARGPDFHFGDKALKELVIAHVFDLVVGHMEGLILGGRRDAMAHRNIRPDRSGRDRRILRGERPFTGASDAAAPTVASLGSRML